MSKNTAKNVKFVQIPSSTLLNIDLSAVAYKCASTSNAEEVSIKVNSNSTPEDVILDNILCELMDFLDGVYTSNGAIIIPRASLKGFVILCDQTFLTLYTEPSVSVICL